MTNYLTAHEIRDIAARTAATLLPLEKAAMLPVPMPAKGSLEALVVYYDETGPPLRRTVHPPTHAMRLDARTGRILDFSATTPERLGIRRPLVPVVGARIDPAMGGMEFAAKRARLLDLSRDVWCAFEAGGIPDAAAAALVREYWKLFLQITKPEVAPFYIGAAGDYFVWLQKVVGSP